MTEKKHYYDEINIMRGIAVLCVVIGHSFNATDIPTVLGFLKSFVYCFHMPVFFFISGFLIKEQNMNWNTKISKIVEKAKRLMIPYLFLTLITIVLKMVFVVFARNPLNYSTLVLDVLIGKNNPNGGLWFLYALFVISTIGILLNEVDKRIIFVGTFIGYLFNTFVLYHSNDILSFFLEYAWYYFGGSLMKKYGYTRIKSSGFTYSTKGKITIDSVFIAYIIIAFIRVYINDAWVLSCIVTVIGVFLLFVISIRVEYFKRGKYVWMLLGDYGMDIYMIGYYVQQTIYVLLGKVLKVDYIIYAWCMCIFGLIGSVIISKYIIRRNKLFSLLILGR